jgi:glycerol-1-phosphate dehydrogenase [NAD(P)+]
VVGSDVTDRIPSLFREQFPGQRAAVVCDATTAKLIGKRIDGLLTREGLSGASPFVFHDAELYAETRFVRELERWIQTHDAIPVAVGSGTINDLVKLASHRSGRAYLCAATAASMDGYTAFGASITHEGAKQTFHCPAPRAVIADITVMKDAPSKMSASGYADLLAKVTAGADWLLADALGVEPLDVTAWQLVQGGLREALKDPAGVRVGDAAAITSLTEGLMLGGFAMQWHQSSRPASGAEHQFSHLWDMEHHVHNGEAPSHGFKVGLATLAVTSLYEEILRLPLEQLDVAASCATWPDAREVEQSVRTEFARGDFVTTAVDETLAKHSTREELARQLTMLRAGWPVLRERLREQLIPFDELRQRLRAAGAPTEPEQIGLTRARLRESFHRAYHIRRRFTVLDLAKRTGCLETCLEQLFKGGVWSAPAGAQS